MRTGVCGCFMGEGDGVIEARGGVGLDVEKCKIILM